MNLNPIYHIFYSYFRVKHWASTISNDVEHTVHDKYLHLRAAAGHEWARAELAARYVQHLPAQIKAGIATEYIQAQQAYQASSQAASATIKAPKATPTAPPASVIPGPGSAPVTP